jgi:tyrosinase
VQPNLRDRLYNLFTSYTEFGPFSNKQWNEQSTISGYDSLESLHDEIHIEVGDGGHLYFIQYSAFDPIFFLHHTMTDRILSLWQMLYPDTWVTEQLVTTSSFTISNGTLVNASTPLAPFFSDGSGTFWDSDSSRHTEEFGYSYTEVSGMNRVSDPVRIQNNRARLSAAINQLYGSPGVSAMLQKRKLDILEAPGQGGVRALTRRALDFTSNVISRMTPRRGLEPADSGTPTQSYQYYTEWLANVRAETGTLKASLSVSIFLGPPPEDVHDWKRAPNIIGTVGLFSMSHMPGQNRISGTIPLTSTLLTRTDREGLGSLDIAKSQAYLRHNLEFRVFNSDGEIAPSSVPGLCVEVVSSEVAAATSARELPRWSPAKTRFVMFC